MVMNIENLWSWIAFLMSICKVVCALGICFNDPLDIVFVCVQWVFTLCSSGLNSTMPIQGWTLIFSKEICVLFCAPCSWLPWEVLECSIYTIISSHDEAIYVCFEDGHAGRHGNCNWESNTFVSLLGSSASAHCWLCVDCFGLHARLLVLLSLYYWVLVPHQIFERK